MLPKFTSNGSLPAGVHEATWEEFIARFGSTITRKRIIAGLRAALTNLFQAGCGAVFIDGSFVTNKENPNDFDACWDLNGVDPALLDPILLRFDDGRAAQKAKYRGEMFPAQMKEGNSNEDFLEFFQTDKETGAPKGIVLIRGLSGSEQ